MKYLTPHESFQMGQRCGHIDGKRRVGQYVIGEACDMAEVAGAAQKDCITVKVDITSFKHGFADGYILGATGDKLVQEDE